MRNTLLAVTVAFAALLTPAVSHADDAADRSAAILACRQEAATQTGADLDSVRLDQVRVRSRVIRVELDVWREGSLQNVRCEVDRTQTPLTATLVNPGQAVAAR